MASTSYYFSSSVYTAEEEKFLADAKAVTADYVQAIKGKPDYVKSRLIQTEWIGGDQRIHALSQHIADLGWETLQQQGYAMQGQEVYFLEYWAQEHQKHSGMDEHVHGFGSQLVGFYFLDCPDENARVVFSDPNQAKKQINLMQADQTKATFASTAINFQPKAGMLMMTNSWVPHLFTRNESDKPFTFIHFSLGVRPASVFHAPAEVI